MKKRVLILCTGNSARSQMAEALVNVRLGDTWQAFSAGTQPAERVNPYALWALAEIGIVIEGSRPKSLREFTGQPFDLVITVCDDAAENCPVWAGQGKRLHIGFPDPAQAVGDDETVLAVFRQVRDDIATHLLSTLMFDQRSPGDFPPNPLEKPGYRLEFHDEFEGPSLDTAKWLPFYLPHWSSRTQSALNYAFENSNLVLQITQDQAPWCPEFDGEVRCSSIQTGQFSGSVGSAVGQHRFSKACLVREAQTNVQNYVPQYGYFELRAKGLRTSANHVSLWMIGYEDTPEKSGEIAVFELLGAHTSSSSSRVGQGVRSWADPTLKDEFYEQFLTIDAAQFHIYGLEWTPTHLDFFVDNIKIRTIHQSPHYPMQFMLNIYEHPFEGAWTGIYDPNAPYPKRFTVDYFRAYQPNTGY